MKKVSGGKATPCNVAEGVQAFVDTVSAQNPANVPLTGRNVALKLQSAKYDAKLILKTRRSLKISRAVFAQFLGTTTATVRAWEEGTRKPGKMACRFMDELRLHPAFWRTRLAKLAIVIPSVSHQSTATSTSATILTPGTLLRRGKEAWQQGIQAARTFAKQIKRLET